MPKFQRVLLAAQWLKYNTVTTMAALMQRILFVSEISHAIKQWRVIYDRNNVGGFFGSSLVFLKPLCTMESFHMER